MPRLQLLGKVVGAAMQKTLKVEVTRMYLHPVYKKFIAQRKNYLVHNENTPAMVGDLVKIEECRPMSKLKSFQLVEVVREVPRYTDPDTGKVFTAAD